MFKKTLLLSLLLLISGCANEYVQPTNGATATLTVPNIEGRSFKLLKGGFSGGGGVAISLKNTDGCGRLSKDINLDSKQAEFAIKIPAEKDLFLGISQQYTLGYTEFYCNVAGSFIPARDGKYVLRFIREGYGCRAWLQEDTSETLNTVPLQPAFVSKMDGIKVCDSEGKL